MKDLTVDFSCTSVNCSIEVLVEEIKLVPTKNKFLKIQINP